MENKEIIKLLREKRFSRLSFLEDTKKLCDHEDYYGFRYFMLDANAKSTNQVFEDIVKIQGSKSKAYTYLGNIASEIFKTFSEQYIAASFFRLAIEFDSENSRAWWGLYWATNDPKAFLKSLLIDYENNKTDDVEYKISYIFMHVYRRFIKLDYSLAEWDSMIQILRNTKTIQTENGMKLLALAYFYTNNLDEGLIFIEKLEQVPINVIKKYYQLGKIDLKEALRKVHYLDVAELLDDDSLIYDEYIFRRSQGKCSYVKSFVMNQALKAKKYHDIIRIYYEEWNDKFILSKLENKLYFLIAQSYINQPFDKEAYDYVIRHSRDEVVFKIFEVRDAIVKLENYLEGDVTDPISFMGIYQRIEELLSESESELINHYLYDDLASEVSALADHWDKKYFKKQFDLAVSNIEENSYLYDDFIDFCHYGVRNNQHQLIMDKLKDFHIKNVPTVTTHNILAICYEEQEMYKEAYEQYLQALQIMEQQNDYNDVVIQNYLSLLNKAKISFVKEHYEYWKEKYNLSLVNVFKWNDFLAEGKNRLYKYSPFNLNTLDSIMNQYFYLPKKDQLNDPIEMPNMSEIGTDSLIDAEYRICSFSSNLNSMLMWSHYTENHQGIMVEYQFKDGLPVGIGIGKVEYSNGEKRNKEQDKYIFNQFLLTKNQEWSYEQEIRLISYKIDKAYYESYQYPNPDRSKINAQVVSITLGYKFPDSKLQLIKNLVASINARRKEHEPKVQLKKAQISEKNLFALEYVTIDI